MSLHSDIASTLRRAWSLPTNGAAGTVSSTAFRTNGMASGSLELAVGAASGTPTTQSVTAKFMVADDDGTGSPGSFALYTGPDGVAAQVAITADSLTGKVAIKYEGSVTGAWGRVDVVTAFTGGSTPKIPASAVLIFNDSEVPARAVVFDT